jgi:prophage antirepressor-like protein
MKDLQLVKSDHFGEVEADIYSDGADMFMTINQLATCLEYASKSGVENILSRNEYLKKPEFSSTHKLWVDGKERETRAFNEDGIYEVTFLSGQPKAKKFRAWLREVVKSIRKTGFYGTPAAIDTMLSNPDTMIKMLTAYKEEKEGRATAETKVKELTPKATYCDHMLDNPGLVPISSIAKDFGMSARALNKMLHDYGVQYKQGDQWLLYAKYQDCGYVGSKPFDITHTDGSPDVKPQTQWTQLGRKFIYDLLKSNGILPIVERPPFIKAKGKQDNTAATA